MEPSQFHFTFAAAFRASTIKLASVEEMNFQRKNVLFQYAQWKSKKVLQSPQKEIFEYLTSEKHFEQQHYYLKPRQHIQKIHICADIVVIKTLGSWA